MTELTMTPEIKTTTKFSNDFSKEIFEQTYCYKNETIDQAFDRVATHLASVEGDKEHWRAQFNYLLQNFTFVPGGRILSNAGLGLKGTSMINCFVSGFQGEGKDSMLSILDELRRQALILKSEGGYGVCIDILRPRGAFIEGIANESPGSTKMLDMWDTQSGVITAGSGKKSTKEGAKIKIRKGAQMVTQSIWHPDVEEFITAKQTPGKLTKFNMSVLITDDFMNAVKNNLPWNLEFPDIDAHKEEYNKEWDGNINKWKEKYGTVVYKRFDNANELWDKIMLSTYNRNEPGVLFIDTINKLNNLYYNEYINATNPCLSGDTWVQTLEDGPVQIKNIVGLQKQLLLDGSYYPTTKDGFFPTGNKEVFEIQLKNGLKIKATSNHKFMMNKEWVEVKDLKIGDTLILSQNSKNHIWKGIGGSKEEGWLIGNLIGDGHLTGETACFNYWNENKETMYGVAKSFLEQTVRKPANNRVYEYGEPTLDEAHNCLWITSQRFVEIANKWNITKENKSLNSTIEQGSSDFYKGVLGGLFDADGSVWGGNQQGLYVSISQSNLPLLESAQRMLLRFGIESNVILSTEAKQVLMPDGKGGRKLYDCKTNYELRVCGRFMVNRFFSTIFVQDRIKRTKYEIKEGEYMKVPYLRSNMFSSSIESIIQVGTEMVFDCTVPELHAFEANGIVTHNCGEQLLPIGGVCLLGSLNLTQFVNKKGDNWDFKKLGEIIPIAVRFMDNVNDLTYVPLPEQAQNLRDKRRIGLGVMGYGSALMMMKTRYGSPKALELTQKLEEFIANTAYQSSAKLAEEKGSFPLFDVDKYLNGQFVKNLTPETLNLIKEKGLRNSHLLSIQPTGNTGIFANVVSGGLEPVFMPVYKRTSIMPYPPEGLILPININWGGKSCDSGIDWNWVKEGDENLLTRVFNGDVYKIDQSRGLLRETVIKDYAVEYLEKKEQWDPKAEWAATTTELTIDEHVETMEIFATFVDSAISKCMDVETTQVVLDDKIYYLDELPYNKTEDSFSSVTHTTQNHKNEVVKVKSVYNNGVKDCVKVTFDDNSFVIGTYNHKIYTSNGWIDLINLKLGTTL